MVWSDYCRIETFLIKQTHHEQRQGSVVTNYENAFTLRIRPFKVLICFSFSKDVEVETSAVLNERIQYEIKDNFIRAMKIFDLLFPVSLCPAE